MKIRFIVREFEFDTDDPNYVEIARDRLHEAGFVELGTALVENAECLTLALEGWVAGVHTCHWASVVDPLHSCYYVPGRFNYVPGRFTFTPCGLYQGCVVEGFLEIDPTLKQRRCKKCVRWLERNRPEVLTTPDPY